MISRSALSLWAAMDQPPMNLQFRASDHKIFHLFQRKGKSIFIKYDTINGLAIRSLVSQNGGHLPWVAFIHGAPGSSMDYHAYLADSQLTSSINMISIDRPGYGYSGFGNAITSIDTQAALMSDILQIHCGSAPLILVGHSFGGPIAARIAMKKPGLASSLIMLAPANDPNHEKILKIAHLAAMPFIKNIIPTALRVAADEKFTHQEELIKMADDWSRIHIPVCHMHGRRDRLVPYENMDYSKSRLVNSDLFPVTLEHEDHFLPWTQKKLIIKIILDYAGNHRSNR